MALTLLTDAAHQLSVHATSKDVGLVCVVGFRFTCTTCLCSPTKGSTSCSQGCSDPFSAGYANQHHKGTQISAIKLCMTILTTFIRGYCTFETLYKMLVAVLLGVANALTIG